MDVNRLGRDRVKGALTGRGVSNYSTAPIVTGKFCIDAVPHTVPGTNAGRVSCR